MNIFVFSFFWDGIHLATELDLVRNHMKSGDNVTVVICGGIVSRCAANTSGLADICNHCTSKRIILFQSVGAKVTLLSQYSVNLRPSLPFTSVSEIKATTYDGHNFGLMSVSTYASMMRKINFDCDDLRSITDLYDSAIEVYESSKKLLKTASADLIYVFNQRFVPIYGAICAARKLGVKFVSHERGAKPNMYALYPDGLVHNCDYIHSECERLYLECGAELAERKGSDFFAARRANAPSNGFCFTLGQINGQLPNSLDHENNNVVIFLSSDDEYYFLGDDWIDPRFGRQLDAFTYLVENYRGSATFWVRAHPNMAQMDSKITGQYKKLTENREQWNFIEPESSVSTYSLIDTADKVVTFGSTTGIEAAYYGKVSICLGVNFYRNLGSTYTPLSLDDALSMIDKDLLPLPKLGAIKYGNYLESFGVIMQDYEAIDLLNGTYLGNSVNDVFNSNLGARVTARFNKPHVLPATVNIGMKSFFHRLKTVEQSIFVDIGYRRH